MTNNQKVTQLFKKTAYALNRIIVGRDTLWATPEHKFFIAAKGWVQAAGLTAGMLMQSHVGTAAINSNVAIDTVAEVYNFTVENNHTYYVGKENLLTHNECGPLGDLLKSLGDKQGDFLKHFGDNIAANNFIKNKFVKGELNIETWEALVAVGVTNGDWLAMCNKLGNKWNKALVNKLASDLATNPSFKAFFNAASAEKRAKFLNAYRHLSELNGPGKQWLKTNTKLLDKLQGETDELIEKVKAYYKGHNSHNTVTIYPSTSNTGIYYDAFGHPDFTPHVPRLSDGRRVIYKPTATMEALTGERVDMSRANVWALKPDGGGFNSSNFIAKNNDQCEIFQKNPITNQNEWITCTWHHHEDGKTLIPVPSVIHDRNYAPHIGGAATIDKKIQGFFNGPIFN